MIRSNICLNAHGPGCEALTLRWVSRALSARPELEAAAAASGRKYRSVLVLGGSTGYGLATRTAAAFALGADTVSVSFEREHNQRQTGTPGWYNNRAFDRAASEAGLGAWTKEADAFADSTRDAVIDLARTRGQAFDLVVYSLASPVRTEPGTGRVYRSVIKPLGSPYEGRSLDVFTGKISTALVQPATEEEAAQTVKVMGGEDWELWVRALSGADVLAPGAETLAYTYIGPEYSWPIYRSGALGRAKAHLEATALSLDAFLKPSGGSAWAAVMKAVVTRASAVIPVIPLYVSTLLKTMKERGVHEDCMDQGLRLFRDRLLVRPV
ncbi:MAG TPA: bifunctional NADH-specific enoyl-ACP reductase/trans-2-enoyl-CoA reductase, partial [Magnetospirillaceae bacterium]|nr:bifunctional NADH-specific enoyl-ACP reductase/trans-2-enoyl-CoA reductase [Magnetospirillaceae bacterium]